MRSIPRQALASATGALILVSAGCSRTAGEQASPPAPPQVPVAQVVVRPVTPFAEFTGALTAVKSVELRPRVSGYIQAVAVPEGGFVRQGRPLFVVDPRPFQAALDSAQARRREAEASLSEARAALGLAEVEAARAQRLFAEGVAARERVDQTSAELGQRRAQVLAAQAQVGAARAAVNAARLDVGFTRVSAPISGRVGQVLVTEGNYVASGTTPLTTIVSVAPLHVYFDVDEATYLRSLAAAGSAAGGRPTVEIALATDEDYVRSGRVDFVANAVERGTGTIRVRAVVDNPDGRLSPGLFARVKLLTGQPEPQVLVADASIGTDQGRRYMLVVGPDNKTQYRSVELGPVVDGLRVIEQGLRPGERVVVKGLVGPGMAVTPQPARITGEPLTTRSAAAAPSPAAAR